ncbi:hypothetical protein E4U60_004379 [Claviceps pazoutovae]|uniref:Uncharacterized protein n=1 Tax=Claviceps pazoutovae TaxID=1649127 RepID=A0A9P7SKB8_9HYPO|nr:hypothetical protein E4U60_004379 [Claviceps pazoutovae]
MQITLMIITDVLMGQREVTTAENERWYIILDEKSMIGLRTLYNVDQRLYQTLSKPLYKQASADRQQKFMPKECFDRSVFLKQVYWLSPSDVAGFEDALRIYWTNDQVNTYNREHLEKFQKPTINIVCSSTSRESNAAASRFNPAIFNSS